MANTIPRPRKKTTTAASKGLKRRATPAAIAANAVKSGLRKVK